MRQAILIVLLIAAAFLGGAFVNGPGLQWAQARVLRSLGLSNGGEIAAVDLESSVIGSDPAEQPKSSRSPRLQAPSLPCLESHRNASPANKTTLTVIATRLPQLRPPPAISASNQSRPVIFTFGNAASVGDEIFLARPSPYGPEGLTGKWRFSLSAAPVPLAQAEEPEPPALLGSLATLSPSAESLTDSDRISVNPPVLRTKVGSSPSVTNGRAS